MLPTPPTITVPLQTDVHGAIRVSGTRITLDVVLARYQLGDTPEAIHAGFDTLPLNDIYAVIAYYLANRDELDAYLRRREAQVERVRSEVEASYTDDQRKRLARFKRLADEKRRDA